MPDSSSDGHSVEDEDREFSPTPSPPGSEAGHDDNGKSDVAPDESAEKPRRSSESNSSHSNAGDGAGGDAGDAGDDDDRQSHKSEGGKDDAEDGKTASPSQPMGLITEPDTAHYQRNLVVVHGLTKTHWAQEQVPPTGTRTSVRWLIEGAGFDDWRISSFFYDLEGDDVTEPSLFQRDGIEREALKLLEQLTELRQHPDDREDPDAEQWPINFIAHDVGAAIVKKALVIAIQNPAKYADIAYNTTGLIFLGAPHRGSALDLEDALARLLYLPSVGYHRNLHEKVETLARSIQLVNGEFYDAKMLMRAYCFNIYNEGVFPPAPIRRNDLPPLDQEETPTGERVQAPFEIDTMLFDSPFEMCNRCQVPHELLVNGGNEENTDNNFPPRIQSSRSTETHMVLEPKGESTSWAHRLFLAAAPPAVPAQPSQICWQPYFIEEWMVNTDAYQHWLAASGINILHVYGTDEMAILSQELHGQLQSMQMIPNVIYFEFRRHDVRYNNLRAMLLSFITHIMTRFPWVPIASSYSTALMMPGLLPYCSLSLTDLLNMFRAMIMWRDMPTMLFIVACLDDCDAHTNRFLALLHSMREITEGKQRFIITSSPDEKLKSRLAGAYELDTDDFDKTSDTVWTDTFDGMYGFHLNRLRDRRPAFRESIPELTDILQRCSPDHRLGSLISRWLTTERRGVRDTRSGARKLIESLQPATADSALHTIVNSFGQDSDRAWVYIDWLTVVFRPLTLQELAFGVNLSLDMSQETIDFIDYGEIYEDVHRFGRVMWRRDNEVELWLPYYKDGRHYTEEARQKAHGRVARVCLEYLCMDSTREAAVEWAERFIGLHFAICQSRDTLRSYAAEFWAQHYEKAGDFKPQQQARDFFANRSARNAWRLAMGIIQPLSMPDRDYMSVIPLVASTGLDDLLLHQLDLERESETFKADTGLALVEVARSGHAHLVPLLKEHAELDSDIAQAALQWSAANDDWDLVRVLLDWISTTEIRLPLAGLFEIFCRAVWSGQKEMVRMLQPKLSDTPDLDQSAPWMPLHLAVRSGEEEMVQLVLEISNDIGLNLELQDKWGYTALQVAATGGDPAIVRCLVAKGANTTPEQLNPDTFVQSPMHLAVGSGHHRALEALLEGGADPNFGIPADDGPEVAEQPPLIVAATKKRYIKSVDALLRHKADPSATVSKCSSLLFAIENGSYAIAKALLEAGADPNDNPDGYDLALLAAVREESLPMTILLLNHGARVDEEDSSHPWRRTALSRAAGLGNQDIVELLLEKGAKPDFAGKDSQHPLYAACYDGRIDIVKILLEKGVDVNQKVAASGWTALHASYDNTAITELLIEKDADVNALSGTGTPLYLACKYNFPDVVDLLLNKNAEINIVTEKITDDLEEIENGMTALSIACYNGHVEIMEKLLKAKPNPAYPENQANPDHMDKSGNWPLRLCLWRLDTACQAVEVLMAHNPNMALEDPTTGAKILHCVNANTPVSIVRDLVTAGADISAEDNNHHSPLMIALDEGNTDVAEFLIMRGADVNQYENVWGTPLHIACARGNLSAVKSLVDAGADAKQSEERGYNVTLLCALTTHGPRGEARTLDLLNYLLDEIKVDPNVRSRKQPYYPLTRAIRQQDSDFVKILIAGGAKINVEDYWGIRPIHVAAWESVEAVTIVREAGEKEPGFDLFPLNKVGMSPVHYALAGRIWDDSFDDYLKSAGVSINKPDVDGWAGMLWAAKSNYSDPQVIQAVLDRGGSVWDVGNGPDGTLWSPLKVSRYYGSQSEIYELLTPKDGERTRLKADGSEDTWNDEQHLSREGQYHNGDYCDMCLLAIYGAHYRCNTCDVDLCYKCSMSRQLFDPDHTYEEVGLEFIPSRTPSPGEATVNPGDGTQTGTSDAGSDSSESLQTESDELNDSDEIASVVSAVSDDGD